MENEGWIKLHRKLLDTSFFNKPTTGWLFIHLLLRARHQPKTIIFNDEELEIKEGQLITGRLELAKNTGLTVMQVRYALYSLKITNTITIKTTNKFSVISICKWKQYQEINQQINQPVTNKQPTSNQPVTTNNNGNNVKNVIKETLRVSKKPAKKSCPLGTENHSKCIDFLNELAKMKNLPNGWIFFDKQIGFLHILLRKGYSIDDIKAEAVRLDSNNYMWDKWDMATIASQIEKQGREVIIK